MPTYRVTSNGNTFDIAGDQVTVVEGVLNIVADGRPAAAFARWDGYVDLAVVVDPGKQAVATLDKLTEALAKHGRSIPAA